MADETATAGNTPEPPKGSGPILGKVIRETLSFSFLQTIGQVFLWASNLALARLLSPKDFGTYDICIFFLSLGSMVGDAGLGSALLRQPKEPKHEQYATVFFVNVTMGGVLGLALALAAPWLADAYGLQTSARWILVAMAPVYVLSTFRTMPLIRLERELRFGAIAVVELIVMFVRQGAAVLLAFLGYGVWALVVSAILASLLTVVGMLKIKPFLPRPKWDFGLLKPLLLFGIKVQALGFIAFFKDNLSNALLGILGGSVMVGLFNFGVRYIQVPILAVNALARVQLPVYAQLQEDREALANALRGALRLSFILGVPMLVVLAAGASFLVPLLYSAKWSGTVPIIWSLLPNMAAGLAASPLFTLLQARNEAGVALTTFLVWTLSTWALAGVAWFAGLSLVGIGAAHSVVTVVVTVTLLLRTQRSLGRSLFKEIAGPTVAGILAVGAHAAAYLAPGWIGRAGRHPATLLLLPLVVFLLAEITIEGRKVLDEARTFVASARRKRA